MLGRKSEVYAVISGVVGWGGSVCEVLVLAWRKEFMDDSMKTR